ncbi:YveK family protein [Clostridium tarantellae]|uniref:Polysaccharide chain length determinant N-terminal domain-containing protein n=1 Tax=Clostridium tarantellae TaxID=39493 RepID=A0A6I1MMW5_9CLOT|nr:Wzz/FepE/Etk N-terminal domain-containing protein [Clostridium tarantellae]MPQ44725.1 hypothetical protein [Clostridium tarantellae]
MEEKTLNINEILYSIRKRFKIVAFCTGIIIVIFTIIAFKFQKPKYYATTRVFVGKYEESKLYTSNELDSYKQLMATYMDLVKTEDIIAKALKENESDKTAGEVLGSLQLVASDVSPTMRIKVAGKSEEDASKTVRIVLTAFDKVTKELLSSAKIGVIDSTKTFTVKPNKFKFSLIGFILGIVLSLAIVFVLDYFDNTVKSKKDLEAMLELPIIGTIPREHF